MANLKGQMSDVANAEPVEFAICHLPFAVCDAAEKFETVTEVAPMFHPFGVSGVFSCVARG